MNEFQIIIGISIIFFSGMAVVYSADIKGEVTDLSRINLLCLLLFVCAGAMWVAIDYNETTLPEYRAGYNDYPDNTTYNKIAELDKIDLDMQHYKNGWEQAERDTVKIEFENSIDSKGD